MEERDFRWSQQQLKRKLEALNVKWCVDVRKMTSTRRYGRHE